MWLWSGGICSVCQVRFLQRGLPSPSRFSVVLVVSCLFFGCCSCPHTTAIASVHIISLTHSCCALSLTHALPIQLDLSMDNSYLDDQFLWDPFQSTNSSSEVCSPHHGVAEFATQLCKDIGLRAQVRGGHWLAIEWVACERAICWQPNPAV